MRLLVLAIAVLLSCVALLWIGRVDGGHAVSGQNLFPTLEPGQARGGPAGHSATSEELEVLAVDPMANGSSDPGGREAASTAGFEGRGSGSTVELILRARAELATGPPEVHLLRARENLEAPLRTRGSSSSSGQSKERWRWERAVTYGEAIGPVPDWQQGPSQGGRRAPFEIRLPMVRPGRLDRVFARMGDTVSVGRLMGSTVVIDFAQRYERLAQVSIRNDDGSPASGVPFVMGRHRGLSGLGTGGRKLNDLPRTDKSGHAQVMGLLGSQPRAILLGLPPVLPKGGGFNEIMLPPAGVLEVEYVYGEDSQERRFAGAKKTLSIESVDRVPFTFDGTWRVATRLEDGRATLHTALNQRFRLTVNGYLGRAVAEVEGPTEPGQVVTVELNASAMPTLSFTALDPEGVPLADRHFTLVQGGIGDPFDNDLHWSATANEHGVVRFPLRGAASTDLLGAIYLRCRQNFDGSLQRALVGDRRVEEPFVEGKLDLGEWRLRPIPHLVSGRVVDQSGDPVSGATIRVAPRTRAPQEHFSKDDARKCFGTSGPDGQFTIAWDRDTDLDDQRSLALTATKGAAKLFRPMEFTPGDRNVEIVVTEPGSVLVDLRHIDPNRMQDLQLSLVPENASLRALGAEIQRGEELSFGEIHEIEQKEPGPYALRLSFPPESANVVSDIVIEPGERLEDSRLNPLMLEGAVQRRTIFVTGADGAALPSIVVGRVRSGDLERSSTIESEGGAFHVPAYLRSPPDSYWIQADGYRRATVDVLRDGMALELRAPIEVIVQLKGADLPGTRFNLSAKPSSNSPGSTPEIKVSFDALGRGSFRAPQPGSYVLGGVRRTRGRPASASASKPWWGASFTVSEEGGEVEVAAGR